MPGTASNCANLSPDLCRSELFAASLKSSRASSLLQVQLQPPACGAYRPGRRGLRSALSPACLHCINPVRASLSRELFVASLKSSRDKLAPTGFVQCKHAGDKADRSPLRPGRKTPHAGGCAYRGQAMSWRSSKQSRACQSVSSGHGFSGTLTSTVLLPAARPQSRSKR